MAIPPQVIISPGQGAQAVGMARIWCEFSPAARKVFQAADAALGTRLGHKLSDLCFNGPAERLNQTDASQPAIYTASIACWQGLLAEWSMAANETDLIAAAGLSLGEYTALCVAGAISFEDGLELVTLRGRAMQDAAEAQPSSMLALIGADEPQARTVCDQAAEGDVLVPANFNAPGQIVLSGHKAAITRAASVATELGLRATELAVAGAFHSPLMAPAADRLRDALARTPIRGPRCPVISNVTASPHGSNGSTIEDSIRQRLVDQLTSPVRWAESCQTLSSLASARPGVEFHELAPGKTLAGLMRRIDRNIKVTTHEEPSQTHAA
ncbi:MAG: ACP S-malonyltransferase [Phycisphaeraceae bacterium]|nr:ACP S-malonyltransferase [Phycisphaeraceae bacterium]